MKFSFKKYKDQYPKAVKVLIKCPSLFTFYRYPGVIRRSIVIDYNKKSSSHAVRGFKEAAYDLGLLFEKRYGNESAVTQNFLNSLIFVSLVM